VIFAGTKIVNFLAANVVPEEDSQEPSRPLLRQVSEQLVLKVECHDGDDNSCAVDIEFDD
jgi:hypothetical protein